MTRRTIGLLVTFVLGLPVALLAAPAQPAAKVPRIGLLNSGGRPARVFMQEELFGPEEYRQVVAYHYGMARHHLCQAQTYREHAKARFGLQLPLFEEDDGGESVI
jgi:hypothetical protein